jgi:hypothetical protein
VTTLSASVHKSSVGRRASDFVQVGLRPWIPKGIARRLGRAKRSRSRPNSGLPANAPPTATAGAWNRLSTRVGSRHQPDIAVGFTQDDCDSIASGCPAPSPVGQAPVQVLHRERFADGSA